MNTLLITPQQVNALAFRGELDDIYISNSAILAAQERYIRTPFDKCYDMLTSAEEPYPEFMADYLQPAMAQYIKLDILPSLSAQTGTSGVIQYGGAGNTRFAADPAFERLLRATKRDARTLMRRAICRAAELGLITKSAQKPII